MQRIRQKNIIRSLTQFEVYFIWLFLAVILPIFIHNPLTAALTLVYFLYIPGKLLLLSLGLKKLPITLHISVCVSISLLYLMLLGIGINSLHFLGIDKPLTKSSFLISLLITGATQIFLNKKYLRREQFNLLIPRIDTTEKIAALFSIILVGLSVFGSIRLNNGASNVLTLSFFFLVPVSFMWLLFSRKLTSRGTLLLLYSIGFAILLTNSLRGLSISGHDSQLEFMVFQHTLKNGYWSLIDYRDAYNACISITLLPTLIQKISGLPDLYIYKVLFQALFALTVLPVFGFASTAIKSLNIFSTQLIIRLAAISTYIFLTFITFLNDMPFLNRQEIAFIFFCTALLLNITDYLQSKQRIILILICSMGMILSHYSTSYTYILLITFSLTFYGLARLASRLNVIINPKFKLTKPFQPSLLMLILLLTFLWNSQITVTSDGLSKTVKNTIASIANRDSTRSPDVGTSIFGGAKKITQEELLSQYGHEKRLDVSDLEVVEPELNSLTTLGRTAEDIIPGSVSLNAALKTIGSKLLQLAMLIGVFVIFRLITKRNRYTTTSISVIFPSFMFAAIFIVALVTFLPQLSISYGVLRIFQQLLPILSIPMLIGFLWGLSMLKSSVRFVVIAAYFAWLSCETSGFIPTLLGGSPAVFSQQNKGFYYRAYYIHKSEMLSASWIKYNIMQPRNIAMDDYSRLRFPDLLPFGGINKWSVLSSEPKVYVYNDYANSIQNIYDINFKSNIISYRVKGGIDQSLVYSNGETKIYGEVTMK